ncbi:hypothetical protein STEG23_021449, partial [Scotinomys teguina]
MGIEDKKKDVLKKMTLSEMYDCRVLTGNSDEIGTRFSNSGPYVCGAAALLTDPSPVLPVQELVLVSCTDLRTVTE